MRGEAGANGFTCELLHGSGAVPLRRLRHGGRAESARHLGFRGNCGGWKVKAGLEGLARARVEGDLYLFSYRE